MNMKKAKIECTIRFKSDDEPKVITKIIEYDSSIPDIIEDTEKEMRELIDNVTFNKNGSYTFDDTSFNLNEALYIKLKVVDWDVDG